MPTWEPPVNCKAMKIIPTAVDGYVCFYHSIKPEHGPRRQFTSRMFKPDADEEAKQQVLVEFNQFIRRQHLQSR